jgi:hypothetical protein
MPRYRLRTLLIVLAIVAVLGGYAAYSWQSETAQNIAVDSFSKTIPLGMPRGQVNQICRAACVEHHGWTYWPEVTPYGSSVAVVQSPVAFGATNHVVYVVFDHDAVAAVLVRTLDVRSQWPREAPHDRIADDSLEVLKEF